MSDIVVCAAGLKGARFLSHIVERGLVPDRVASYRQADDRSDGFSAIAEVASACGSRFDETRRPVLGPDDLVLIVGWQYLLTGLPIQSIVFHDSLLPRYRGFAPTVTALILGDQDIGVTALRPTEQADEGPIYARAQMQVIYPIKIAQALESQAQLMGELALDLAARWRAGELDATPQNGAEATYSLWRDELDYRIDWLGAAVDIARFVDAVGFPYGGARTAIDGEELVVNQATVLNDLPFAIRQPGKIWRLDPEGPVVVCGRGLLRLDDCRTRDGAAFKFKALRKRLV